MPRQIDLFPKNLQVNNDPTNRLSVSSAQINHLNAQIPIALEKAELAFITAVLAAIDQATGLDLESFTQKAQAGITYTGNLAGDLWNYLAGTNTVANDAWAQFEHFFTTWNISDLTTAFTDVLALFVGTSTAASWVGSISAPTVTKNATVAQPVSNFPNSASVVAGGGWSWDGATSFAGSGGSVKFTGTMGALRGVVSPVQAGQKVILGSELQWSGVSYTGSNPFQLQLIPWNGDTPGTPIVVAQTASPASSATWTTLAPVSSGPVTVGIYTVPSSGVTAVQMRLLVQNLTAGTVNWADCTTLITGGYIATIEALTNQLQIESQEATAATQTFFQSLGAAVVDDAGNLAQFWTDATAAAKVWWSAESGIAQEEIVTLEQIIDAAFGINSGTNWLVPPTNVQGVGFQSLEDTFVNTYNQLGAALGGDVADAGGLAWLAQLMNGLGVNSSSPLWPFITQAADTQNTVANVSNRPLAYGLDDTTECGGVTYSQATATYSLKAPTSVIAFVRCQQVDAKGTIGFTTKQGGGTPPSGMFVNLYKVDFANSSLDYITTTTFVTAQLESSTETWAFANAAQTPVLAGDVLAVEWQSTDSTNTTTLYGASLTKPAHPTARLPAYAATRSAGTSAPTGNIAFSSLTFTNAFVPYVGLETTNPPAPTFFPVSNSFTTNSSYTIQTWDNVVDVVVLGAGGGGEGELGVATGYGGTSGSWNWETLTVGTDIAAGTTFTVTVGVGGSGGPYFTAGSDGSATTISWTDIHGNPQSLTGAGGYGGNHALGLSHNTLGQGLGAGNITYQGQTYFGGGAQFFNYPGIAPGGGGAGASFFQFGTAGAAGQAWIVDRQT